MVGANFTPFDFISLIAIIVLYYWEPFEDKRRWKKHVDVSEGSFTTFTSVVMAIKTFCVVALFTFSYYTIDTTHVAYQTIMALIITNALLAKFWPLLFVTHDKRPAAALLMLVLFGTALAVVILMVIHRANNGPLYPVPLSMYCVYLASLVFGTWANAHYAGLVRFNVMIPCLTVGYKEKSHKHRHSHSDDVDMPVVTHVRASDYDAQYSESKMPINNPIVRQIVHQPSRMV